MVRQCSILFGCLALGELVVYLTGIHLPSSIIGTFASMTVDPARPPRIA